LRNKLALSKSPNGERYRGKKQRNIIVALKDGHFHSGFAPPPLSRGRNLSMYQIVPKLAKIGSGCVKNKEGTGRRGVVG